MRLRPRQPGGGDNAAHQRKSVRMDAGRGKADHQVACRDIVARQQIRAIDRSDGKAGEIVIAVLIHAGHFGGLAADQGAAGFAAGRRNAGNDGRTHLRIELATGEIVEEEQRLRALHHKVVHRHRDQIDADGVVARISIAILTLVPTPSVAATSIGSEKPAAFKIEKAAKAADLRIRAGAGVLRRNGLINSTMRLPASISTPAAA